MDKKGVDPVTLVRYAARKRELVVCDEVWCVLDVDEFDLTKAVVEARRLGVRLAVSNPCFEYWLLLHFEMCDAPLRNFPNVRARLIRHLAEYDKCEVRFSDFAAGVDIAIERARRRCADVGAEHEHNPSTGVWALVQKLI